MLTRLKFPVVTSLLTGWLLVSCSSDEPVASSCEMKFDISAISRSTTTLSNITDQPFAIFGEMIPTQLAGDLSNRRTVYYNKPVMFLNSAWTTANPQYWNNGHDYSFVAIHPSAVLADKSVEIQYSTSRLSFTYTLPSDYTTVPDILAATHRRRYVDQRDFDEDGNLIGGAADVVSLRFSHIMSRINLAPAFDDNILDEEGYIEIQGVELSGFRNKAVFNITPASLLTADQTDDRQLEVNGHEGTDKLTFTFADPKKIMNDRTNAILFDNDDAIIMLPQTFPADSEAKIVLSYKYSDDPEPKQVSLPLVSQQWELGKSYTYRFTIVRTGLILGTTTISDWNTENSSADADAVDPE